MRQQTPLQKLISEKHRVKQECQEKERRLNESFAYAQENASSLVFSGITSLVFPNSKEKETSRSKSSATGGKSTSVLGLGLADLLPVAKTALPVVWDVVRPILFSYGVTKAQGWLIRSLFRKK